MTTAYESALRVLQVTNRDDPITEVLAKRIIAIAQTDERDVVRMRTRALMGLEHPATEYEEYAELCRKLADGISNPVHKKQLSDMATGWEEVAHEQKVLQ